jgi:hypothetical protein
MQPLMGNAFMDPHEMYEGGEEVELIESDQDEDEQEESDQNGFADTIYPEYDDISTWEDKLRDTIESGEEFDSERDTEEDGSESEQPDDNEQPVQWAGSSGDWYPNEPDPEQVAAAVEHEMQVDEADRDSDVVEIFSDSDHEDEKHEEEDNLVLRGVDSEVFERKKSVEYEESGDEGSLAFESDGRSVDSGYDYSQDEFADESVEGAVDPELFAEVRPEISTDVTQVVGAEMVAIELAQEALANVYEESINDEELEQELEEIVELEPEEPEMKKMLLEGEDEYHEPEPERTARDDHEPEPELEPVQTIEAKFDDLSTKIPRSLLVPRIESVQEVNPFYTAAASDDQAVERYQSMTDLATKRLRDTNVNFTFGEDHDEQSAPLSGEDMQRELASSPLERRVSDGRMLERRVSDSRPFVRNDPSLRAESRVQNAEELARQALEIFSHSRLFGGVDQNFKDESTVQPDVEATVESDDVLQQDIKLIVESAVRTDVEPAVESTVQHHVDPIAESVVEDAAEPIVEAAVQPSVESAGVLRQIESADEIIVGAAEMDVCDETDNEENLGDDDGSGEMDFNHVGTYPILDSLIAPCVSDEEADLVQENGARYALGDQIAETGPHEDGLMDKGALHDTRASDSDDRSPAVVDFIEVETHTDGVESDSNAPSNEEQDVAMEVASPAETHEFERSGELGKDSGDGSIALPFEFEEEVVKEEPLEGGVGGKVDIESHVIDSVLAPLQREAEDVKSQVFVSVPAEEVHRDIEQSGAEESISATQGDRYMAKEGVLAEGVVAEDHVWETDAIDEEVPADDVMEVDEVEDHDEVLSEDGEAERVIQVEGNESEDIAEEERIGEEVEPEHGHGLNGSAHVETPHNEPDVTPQINPARVESTEVHMGEIQEKLDTESNHETRDESSAEFNEESSVEVPESNDEQSATSTRSTQREQGPPPTRSRILRSGRVYEEGTDKSSLDYDDRRTSEEVEPEAKKVSTDDEHSPAKTRRGRRAKESPTEPEVDQQETVATPELPAKRNRGRPSKGAVEESLPGENVGEPVRSLPELAAKRKRGRPSKAAVEESLPDENVGEPVQSSQPSQKKRKGTAVKKEPTKPATRARVSRRVNINRKN